MFHGDIVSITSAGVVVREKALQPLGIYNDSICWGLWAANPHTGHPHEKHPNLIISPFHPSAWPFLIRLQLILENRKGALEDAANLLSSHSLSIIFAECTPTGFTHATWTVIAESTWGELDEVRREKEEFDRTCNKVRLPPSAEYTRARDLANRIAARMLTHVRRLEHVFEEVKLNPPGGRPLLHTWSAECDSHFLYNGEAVAREMQRLEPGQRKAHMDYIESQIPEPSQVKYIQRLAYFSIYGGGRYLEVPFQFKYVARDTLIKRESPVGFKEGSQPLGPLPMPAIGTFNSEDKYLRLCPVMPRFLERSRLARIAVDYEVKQDEDQTQPTHDAKASQGLLGLVCKELAGADVNLLHISNKWTRHGYDNEAGTLSFVADVEKSRHEGVQKRLKSVNDHGPEHLRLVAIEDVSVSSYSEKKLFLSLRFGRHPREESLKQLVEEAAEEVGFARVVVVETYAGSARAAVDAGLHECDAVLQIFYFDVDKPIGKTDFGWLDDEYTTAKALEKKIVRMVDTVRVDYKWWRARFKTAADHYPKSFRTDDSESGLSEKISGAVKELAKALDIH